MPITPVINPVSYAPINPRDYGAKMDGTTDDAAALTATIAALGSSARRRIALPPTATGKMKIASTIQVSTRGLVIEGERGDRPETSGGSQILYTGTGPLFQLGTDDGLGYDRAGYDGVQGFTLRNIALKHNNTDTALTNGQGNYKLGSYGIRDWRGGNIFLDHCLIENFEYGFWGVQSDINEIDSLNVRYCKAGVYLGPRSDQATIQAMYGFFNDMILHIDGATGVRVRDLQSVNNGSVSHPAIRIGSQGWAVGATGAAIEDAWLESNQSTGTPYTVPSFIDVGVDAADTTNATDIRVVGANIVTNTIASGQTRTAYLVRVGQHGDVVILDHPYNQLANLTKLADFTGTGAPSLIVRGRNAYAIYLTSYDNSGGGSPAISYQAYGNSINVLASSNGRIYFNPIPSATNRDAYISTEGGDQIKIVLPNHTSGNTTWWQVRRRDVWGTAVPTSSTWAVGDRVRNMNPSELGTAGSKYVVDGWVCVTAGTPGSWLEQRTLTGN